MGNKLVNPTLHSINNMVSIYRCITAVSRMDSAWPMNTAFGCRWDVEWQTISSCISVISLVISLGKERTGTAYYLEISVGNASLMHVRQGFENTRRVESVKETPRELAHCLIPYFVIVQAVTASSS